jgi:hypothetical protein
VFCLWLQASSLKGLIFAKVNKGQAAPDFTLKDQNGKPAKLLIPNSTDISESIASKGFL